MSMPMRCSRKFEKSLARKSACMESHVTKTIDNLQSEFDENWSRTDASNEFSPAAERVTLFLKRRSLSGQILEHLLPILCETDIERDWMSWRGRLKRIWQTASVSSILADFNKNAVSTDYLSVASQFQVVNFAIQQLERVECQSRCRWGDYPKTINDKLEPGDSRVPCRRVTVHSSQGNLRWFQAHLHELLEFGRQRSDESIEWGENQEKSRVIIESKMSSAVSRRHFTIQLLSPDFAIITNISNTSPMISSNGTPIHCGVAQIMPFPFGLTLPSVRIWCE